MKTKEIITISVSIILLTGFFIFAVNIDSSALENLGYSLPLPLFTLFIALIDGFNPCNMFVLTVLLAILISASASRGRFYLVGLIFASVVFIFYFLFMAAWLNISRYIGYTAALRAVIAVVAIIAGLINCKELFFFKKGISLTIQQKHKGPLYAKMRNVSEVMNKGSLPMLITSSAGLALFSSLIEIPCTAGFPILYTVVLLGKTPGYSVGYFSFLFLYNLVYIMPLLAIIAVFGYTLKARHITQSQFQVIKFIGGIIMILLGIILLANPKLIGAL